jgi:hypothetical protein
MVAARTPTGLGRAGADLWRAIAGEHELDASQKVLLLEACRCKDRLDRLDEILRGDTDTWVSLAETFPDSGIVEVRVTSVLSQSNATSNSMKQLLVSLRLPDAKTGKRPQERGVNRGTYAKSPAKISSLERMRQARES